MYLVDTDVVSELRKGDRANRGVKAFFREAAARDAAIYLTAVTIGEVRRGVELVRYRGDKRQATLLERWLDGMVSAFADSILPFDADTAQVWGRLRVPQAENPLDKQIAATALLHDLVLVTRNTRHFTSAGVKLLDPFAR